MDWANERYVRIYTRDTADLLAIGWEGRAVLWEVLRKCDRAGVLDGDPDTLPDMLRMPREITEAGLPRLLKRGVVEEGEIDGSPCFVVVNFLDAQEAKQSDCQRKRESRARRRERARLPENVTARDSKVTERDQNVTGSHTPSQSVTPCLAVPSRAVPDQDPSDPCQISWLSDGDSALTKAQQLNEKAQKVWDVFCRRRKATLGDARALIFNQTRQAHIKARINEGRTGADFKAAMDQFFNPANVWMTKGHTLPMYLFRSTDQFDKVLGAKPWGDNVTPIKPPSKPTANEDPDKLYQQQLKHERSPRKVGPTPEQLKGFDFEAAKAKLDAELAAQAAQEAAG